MCIENPPPRFSHYMSGAKKSLDEWRRPEKAILIRFVGDPAEAIVQRALVTADQTYRLGSFYKNHFWTGVFDAEVLISDRFL